MMTLIRRESLLEFQEVINIISIFVQVEHETHNNIIMIVIIILFITFKSHLGDYEFLFKSHLGDF